eukprot:1157540-Pelagomonas_calceolata.AAC.14
MGDIHKKVKADVLRHWVMHTSLGALADAHGHGMMYAGIDDVHMQGVTNTGTRRWNMHACMKKVCTQDGQGAFNNRQNKILEAETVKKPADVLSLMAIAP